jgi:rhodanese-related sulfurtransferase
MRRLALLLVLAACTPFAPEGGILAIDAIERHERREIVVVDVRPASEILRGLPKRLLVHVQYGPDEWGAISEDDERLFATRIREISGRPIVLLCQYGVRSATAAEALRRQGIAAESITDGYLGNNYGPGWRTWE